MRIAVEGCSHGCLDQIYASILALDRRDAKKTDLLILCGDVQTLRNVADLHCLAVPDKFKQMGDFHRYYNGQRSAPIKTLMIGGNHEASNYLWELYYGGWVAPNIYYMGAAGCIDVGGLTITGISGIYKSHDYKLGRHERMPYNASAIRSIYHTRTYDVFRLRLFAHLQAINDSHTSISISHDWPNTIEQHGDVGWLTWKRPFFKNEIQTSQLGSPPLMELLHALRPTYWFAAHLHTRFAALVKHSGASTNLVKNFSSAKPKAGGVDAQAGDANPDEIAIDDDVDVDNSDSVEAAPANDDQRQDCTTKFLALSKCLEGQDFLQILDVPAPCDSNNELKDADGQPSLSYNPTWLSVLRATQPFLSLDRVQTALPDVTSLHVDTMWIKPGQSLNVCETQTFVKTAPASTDMQAVASGPPPWYTNPQTVALCSLLGIPNQINPPPDVLPPPPPTANVVEQSLIPAAQSHVSEADEIRRIEEAAKAAMDRQAASNVASHSEEINVTLSDDDEDFARWKEGTG